MRNASKKDSLRSIRDKPRFLASDEKISTRGWGIFSKEEGCELAHILPPFGKIFPNLASSY